MMLLEVKVHYHKIDVCHMSSRYRRIMNSFRRLNFVKLVEYSRNIGWKVHEIGRTLW